MQFLDRNLEAHSANYENAIGLGTASSIPNMIKSSCFSSYNSLDYFAPSQWQTIRFQVIFWSVGSPDVKNNRVSMKFRVTLFWNDDPPTKEDATNGYFPSADAKGDNVTTNARNRSRSIWVMARQSRRRSAKFPPT